ncbi:hypothetical protein FRB91_009186 [Serendipita sp. 411]|nr:hypothetical protein FRB91_009186 [Serendipita sp. 411]
MPTPLHLDSAAYKKAQKLHKKSKKTQASENLPALREQEKTFKTNFPPPPLDDVIDLSWDSELHGNAWKGSKDSTELARIRCHNKETKAYGIRSLPGFVLLPGYLSPEAQRQLIRSTLTDHAKYPNENNLDTHYQVPQDGLWVTWEAYNQTRNVDDSEEPIVSVKEVQEGTSKQGSMRELTENTPASVSNFAELQAMERVAPPPSTTVQPLPISKILKKLRWSNLGYFYHWGTKSYQFDRSLTPVPLDVVDICRACVATVDWRDVWKDGADLESGEWEGYKPDWSDWPQTFVPEAGIVNFYQLKDTLMAHVDKSELSSTSPLVSISLGQASVFLIGGHTRDTQAIPIVLRSGDVLIMSGPCCRRAFHGM